MRERERERERERVTFLPNVSQELSPFYFPPYCDKTSIVRSKTKSHSSISSDLMAEVTLPDVL